MPRKSTRRDFLKGKSAADAAADLVQGSVGADTPQRPLEEPIAGSYLIRIARRAMACQFEVFLNAGQYPNGTQAALEALDLVEALEEQMSVFRPTSELSRLNRTAADGPVQVEPRLFDLLELAWQLYTETDGAFDITSGPLWKVWGFAGRAGTVPSQEQLAEAIERVGSHLVQRDPQRRTVRFRQPGVELNLGSIGKGYALDRCAESLAAAGIDDFLLHGGQSSVLARGSRMGPSGLHGDDSPGGWSVGLRHPRRRGKRLGEVRLHDRALATSGSRWQYFRHRAPTDQRAPTKGWSVGARRSRRYGHILDPRTGQPAEGVLSATAIAPSAAVADALSTAFYVMGAQLALDYCQSRAEIAAVVVCPARQGPGFEIHSAGLRENELRMTVSED